MFDRFAPRPVGTATHGQSSLSRKDHSQRASHEPASRGKPLFRPFRQSNLYVDALLKCHDLDGFNLGNIVHNIFGKGETDPEVLKIIGVAIITAWVEPL